jgi:hypothetical protein
MDDERVALFPLRAGWRWHGEDLRWCPRWEMEDRGISPLKRTRRALFGTMTGFEDFLKFTMEIAEDFPDGWLPTLDTNLRVDVCNIIQYKFYEKEVGSNMVIQMDTAMGANSKMRCLGNEAIRRLANTSELLDQGTKNTIIDNYTQKLCNSGYTVNQARRILITGIKGYEARLKESSQGE